MLKYLNKNFFLNTVLKGHFYYWIKKKIISSKLSKVLSELLPELTCVDIGASYFEHTKWTAFLNSKNTNWIAVEPNIKNTYYKKFWKWKAKFILEKNAIAKNRGYKNLYITNIDSGSSLKKIAIHPNMKNRFTDKSYFYPIKKKKIWTTSLDYLLKKTDRTTPIFLKLDTQGSELDIIRSSHKYIKKKLILGIECEASLLAKPNYQNSTKFYKLSEFMEANNFELIKLDIFHINDKKKDKNNYLPCECDAVFSLRKDIIRKLDIKKKILIFAFYSSYKLHSEMKTMLEENIDLKEYFALNKKLDFIIKLINK
jgi:FkbM family methyltransferase